MDTQGFRDYLQGHGIAEEQIDQHIKVINRFEAYLQDQETPAVLESAGAEATQAFVEHLITIGDNSEDNLVALARQTEDELERTRDDFVHLLAKTYPGGRPEHRLDVPTDPNERS